MNVSVHVDAASLQTSSSRRVFGKLSVLVNGAYFPFEEWDDFVVIVLGWWVEALPMLHVATRKTHFSFMEGPYEFVITPSGGAVQCVKSGRVQMEVSEVDVEQFCTSVVSAARSCLNTVERLGLEDEDSRKLRALLPKID